MHRLLCFCYALSLASYPWVQLAGHKDGFKTDEADPTWICKSGNAFEREALTALMSDPLRSWVPQ